MFYFAIVSINSDACSYSITSVEHFAYILNEWSLKNCTTSEMG